MEQATRKELELQQQLWEERAAGIQNALQAITFQGQLLQSRQEECKREAARIAAALKAMPPATTDGGGVTGTGGAQTEGGGATGTGAQLEGGGVVGTGGAAT